MAFLVFAGHNYQIFYCSKGYPGTMNDLQLVAADPFCNELEQGRMNPVERWECVNDYNATLLVGGYCITDAGLPKTALYMDPTNYDWSWQQTVFVEWVESVRKDIECVFGQLKQRFRRLQNANQSHDLNDVEYCFRTCCALHNMLLKYTGPVKVTDWENYDPDQTEEINMNNEADEYVNSEVNNPHDVAFNPRVIGEQTQQDRTVEWYVGRYMLQRTLLMKHFIRAYELGEVFWPRNFKGRQKETMSIPDPIRARIEENSQNRWNATIYVARSKLFRKDPINNTYTKSIGMGLFTALRIVKGQRITTFNGEVIDEVVYELRTATGRGGYMLFLALNVYLDCYRSRHENQCLASLANCALHCFDSTTNSPAVNNAEYRSYKLPHEERWMASLVATRTIIPQQEILWPYGASYTYPAELSAV